MLRLPARRTVLITALLLIWGGAGGAVAAYLQMPMPWMLGALAASALAALAVQSGGLRGYAFPGGLRMAFIALIGVMIGTQATPELVAGLRALPVSLVAILMFILLAHAGNTMIFTRLGGYDRVTAFYSGAPGGLMESILLGERDGADLRILTLQQFLRIILVVTLVPTALSIWAGEPLGSAAGMVPGGNAPVSLAQFLLVLVAAGTGLAGARLVRLPAGHLVGPLVLTAALTLSGLIELHLPFWLIALAQVGVGTSLGLRFAGIEARHLRRAVALSAVSVAFMLGLGAGIALALSALTGLDLLQLLLSFAPGGVTEMSLIALSLSVNPALVSLFHVLRILLTVAVMSTLARLVLARTAERS